MRLCTPSAALAGLLTLCCPALLGSQALEDRQAEAQVQARRVAVLEGLLPQEDTWPQAAQGRTTGPSEVTAGSDVLPRIEAGSWIGAAPSWAGEPGPFKKPAPMVRWVLHAEQTQRWGILLNSDFGDLDTGWRNTNLILPREGNPLPMESHFITRGWLWYNLDPLELQIGRDRVHWGPLDHSLLVSDAVPFLDMVRARLHAGPWGLDWIVSTPETRDNGGVDIEKTVLMNLHRLEFRTDRFRLAASELYLVSRGPSGPFTLADVFPVMVGHQADMVPNNNCLVLDGEWVPGPGWRVMAQLGLDDIDARTLGLPDNPIPTIWAVQAGGEWEGFWGPAQVTLHGEAGYTHYLWGNFGDPDARAVSKRILFGRTETLPLSSPYGPGTTWLNLRGRWSEGPLTLETRLEVLAGHPGLTLDAPFLENSQWEAWGTQVDHRAGVRAQYALGPEWQVFVEPSEEYREGTLGWEIRVGLERLRSTR